MRLLNVHTFKLRTFYGDKIPPYTILSHTWLEDHEEVTFAQIQSSSLWEWRELRGSYKIDFTCQQAIEDGFQWAWIDTCCIDKTNSSELSEAINSMFNWYYKAETCYVYLTDVDLEQGDDFLGSRWWTRAWTLQELVAPTAVRFYDTNWRRIGTKAGLASSIAMKSGIDLHSLQDVSTVALKSVAQRMSWAANRFATREEDIAYSLIGVFNVNMSMQYGEGARAFVRLQKEIARSTNDMSLLTWGFKPRTLQDIYKMQQRAPHCVMETDVHDLSSKVGDDFVSASEFGLFAPAPSYFSQCGTITFISPYADGISIEEKHGSYVLQGPMIVPPKKTDYNWRTYYIAVLPCSTTSHPYCLLALLLRSHRHLADSFTDFRTMRDAFRGDIYTCLIDSEYTTPPYIKRNSLVKVNPSSIQHYDFKQNELFRTLIINFDQEFGELENHEIKVTPTVWRQDPRNSWMFRTKDDATVRTSTIVRLKLKGSTSVVYIAVRWGIHNKDIGMNMILEPASSWAEEASAMKNAASIRAQAQEQAAICELRKCQDEYLYASSKTWFAYNQATCTLTLGRGHTKEYDKGRNETRRDREAKGCTTICIDWVQSRYGRVYRKARHDVPIKLTAPYGPAYPK